MRAVDPVGAQPRPVVHVSAAVGDRGVGEREALIEQHRVLEHLEREFHVLASQTPGVAPAAQVQIVGLQVLGRLRGELGHLLRRERDAQRVGDLVGDLVLDLEDVRHLAVVAFGPDREAGGGVDQLGVDAQAVARPAQAALEREVGAQLLADLRRGHLLVAEGEHGGAREDVQALDLGEIGEDVLGDAVPQVLVFLHAGEVLEIEDGDRTLRALGRAGLRIDQRRRARTNPSSLRLRRRRSVFSSVADWQRRLRSFSSAFSRIWPRAGGRRDSLPSAAEGRG